MHSAAVTELRLVVASIREGESPRDVADSLERAADWLEASAAATEARVAGLEWIVDEFARQLGAAPQPRLTLVPDGEAS